MAVVTNLAAGTAALAVALVRPAEPPPLLPDSEAPGGYLNSEDLRGVEPDDGHNKVTLGSILFSLGTLQFGAGIVGFVTSRPSNCARVYGETVSDKTCSGLQIYGGIGMAMGGLMFASGVVILSLGLVQRQRHRQWMQERGLTIGPWLGPQRGVAVGFRF
jgi:hypothetical protein